MSINEDSSIIGKFYNWLQQHRWWNYWAPVVFLAGLEFILSSLPTVPQPPFNVPFLDKWEHLVMYATIGFFAKRAFRQSDNRTLSRYPGICAILFCLFYGLSDEFHQSFVPGRDASFYDATADTLGGVLGQLIQSIPFLARF